ncbi:hypothetical protein DITRI_Ditri13aG0087100 [Diplodiscus trichospermus]
MCLYDAYLDTALFSFGIAEKCMRHEKILKFLMSGSNEVEKGELELSLLSDFIQPLLFGVHQQPYASSVIYPSGKISAQKPLPDFVGEMMRDSRITVHPDGRVVLASSETEIKDILSIVAEFYLSSNSTKWRKQLALVPQFNCLKLQVLHLRRAILSLKKSGHELPELLTQFSAGIAGTGLAVLFSVIYKVVCGRVPFCASKLFSTGLGFGLVWLSWAVNGLRDTVVHISKKTSKLGLKEEEMIKRVEKSVNKIYFRAATLMAVEVLRFA